MDVRRLTASPVAAILTGVVCLCYGTAAFANHPVLVEGEQDFDGDGRLGEEEDTDTGADGEPDQSESAKRDFVNGLSRQRYWA